MAKKKIKDIVQEKLQDFLNERGLELWHVEFVKEVKDWFLRVYIDKQNHSDEEYISIEECEEVSRYLSDILDEEDLIEQNYYLEVSSPGMDRQLITREHFERYKDHEVDFKLYKAIDGSKEITAILDNIDEDNIYILDANNNKVTIPKTQLAKAKLAIVF